jgi:hypothetical protein
MAKTILLILFFTHFFHFSSSQTYQDLIAMKGTAISAYYSPGNLTRAGALAKRLENPSRYIGGLVGFKPVVDLLVLKPEHWSKYSAHPVYGMPNFDDKGNRLCVASDDNEFWKSFVPPLDKVPAELAGKIRKTYTTSEGTLSMMAFFDLLSIHELGHGFHVQGGLTMQRLWMQELFVNIVLHTYVAENEPDQLPALEVFPQMVVAGGKKEFKYTTLSDFENRYDNMDARNYGWYQCKLHVAAADIYNAGGKDVLVKLWNVLKQNKEKLNDEQFAALLANKVHPSVARVMMEW